MRLVTVLACFLAFFCGAAAGGETTVGGNGNGQTQTEPQQQGEAGSGFRIDGKVSMPKDFRPSPNWQADTRILINYGQHVAFVKEDGSFAALGVPAGSYVVEVANTEFVFEPVRVEITSKGKTRARKLNFVQPSVVQQIAYPLKLVARTPSNYFRKREEWRVTDMLMNPMVLMMVLPFLLIVLLPKLINTSDPEVQREMQQSLQMPKYEVPEFAEVMASWFGGAKKPKAKGSAAIKGKR